MKKKEFLDILNEELAEYQDELLSTKDESAYHIMALIVDYFRTHFHEYSETDIKTILQFRAPLSTLYTTFIDNEDLDEVIGDAVDIIVDNGTFGEGETLYDKEDADFEDDDIED